MTTRHLLLDAGHCLRVAAPPALTLGLLAATRTAVSAESAYDGLVRLVFQAATATSALWLVIATSWAAARPFRDRRAHQRFQHLRDLAAGPCRALVHIETVIWSSAAGQHAAIINVATGILYRAWLQTTALPTGTFAVVEQREGAVFVVDWMDACSVQAAQRHHRRSVGAREVEQPHEETPAETVVADDALQLIAETENYLRNNRQH